MNKSSYTINVAFVDDHKLVSEATSERLNTLKGIRHWGEIFFSGPDLLKFLSKSGDNLPDILLVDAHMKGMSGAETATEVNRLYPGIRLVALSGFNSLDLVIAMKQAGCCAYLNKSMSSKELEEALHEIYQTGTWKENDFIKRTKEIIRAMQQRLHGLDAYEVLFIKLYKKGKLDKEIADWLCVSPKTLDGYRLRIFRKLNVTTRPEMLIEALRRGIVHLDE